MQAKENVWLLDFFYKHRVREPALFKWIGAIARWLGFLCRITRSFSDWACVLGGALLQADCTLSMQNMPSESHSSVWAVALPLYTVTIHGVCVCVWITKNTRPWTDLHPWRIPKVFGGGGGRVRGSWELPFCLGKCVIVAFGHGRWHAPASMLGGKVGKISLGNKAGMVSLFPD